MSFGFGGRYIVLYTYASLAAFREFRFYYLRQGGYVIVVVCLSVCMFVYLLATLRKNFPTDLHEIFTEGWQWVNEQMIKFWLRSGSESG